MTEKQKKIQSNTIHNKKEWTAMPVYVIFTFKISMSQKAGNKLQV